jgi:hypothetical protein
MLSREVCSFFLRFQKAFRKQRENCEHIFLGKDYNVHFFGTPQRSEPKKRRLGAATPKYPVTSRANADAWHRLIRTRFKPCAALAFAASKRTAKTEKLTNVGSKDFLVLFG